MLCNTGLQLNSTCLTQYKHDIVHVHVTVTHTTGTRAGVEAGDRNARRRVLEDLKTLKKLRFDD